MTTKEKNTVIERALQIYKVKDISLLKNREQKLLFAHIKKLKEEPEAKLIHLKKCLGEPGEPIKPLEKLKAFSLLLSPFKGPSDLKSISSKFKLNTSGLEDVKKIVDNNYELAEYGGLFGLNLQLTLEEKRKIKALNTSDEFNVLGKHVLAKLAALALLKKNIVDVLEAVDSKNSTISTVQQYPSQSTGYTENVAEEEKQEEIESSHALTTVPSVIEADITPVHLMEKSKNEAPDIFSKKNNVNEVEKEIQLPVERQRSLFSGFGKTNNKNKLSKADKVKRSRHGRNKKFKQAHSIINDTYHGDEAEQMLKDYKKEYTGLDELVTDDIFSERAFKLDLVKPELISEPYLDRYFQNVIESYAEYNRDSIEEGYNIDPGHWFDSEANRGRMVIIETTNENLKSLSEAIVDASPLERIVAVGLDESKKENLKTALIEAWERKINSQSLPEAYREKLMDALRKHSNKPKADSLSDFSIQDLSGPHAFTEDKNISYESLKTSLGDSFSSKLDEIILYGSDNNMANHISQLAYKAEVKQYVAIKSGNFNEGDSPFWIGSFNNEVKNPINLLTSSKDSRDIFVLSRSGKNEHSERKGIFKKIKNFFWPGFDTEVITSRKTNFNYNPRFERIFDKSDIQEKDKIYLRALFSQRSLYPTNLSPELYSSTITKTQSGINGEGAVVVGNALEEGNFGRQVATAKGVLFAVNATMFDTANDINLEAQDKMLSYKKMFQNLIQYYKETKNVPPDEAFEKAADDLVTIYTSIEKKRAITENEKRGKLNRIYTLENANKTNKKNRIGINLLLPLPIGVGYGAAATITGLTLAFTGFAASIAFPVVGAAIFITTTTLLAISLRKQKKANADNLARWHRSSARAHASMRKAQDKRENYQKDIIEKLKSGISLNEIISRQNSMDNSSGEDYNITRTEINEVLNDPNRPDKLGEILKKTGVSPIDNVLQSIESESNKSQESLDKNDLTQLSKNEGRLVENNAKNTKNNRKKTKRSLQKV